MNHIDAAWQKRLRDAFEEDKRERQERQRMETYIGASILLLALLLGYALGFSHAHYIHRNDLKPLNQIGQRGK